MKSGLNPVTAYSVPLDLVRRLPFSVVCAPSPDCFNQTTKGVSALNQQRISIGYAITIGLVWVNGPVMLLLIGLPLTVYKGIQIVLQVLAVPSHVANAAVPVVILSSFAIGFVAAWTWWSITVPKWRLWAYERVDDIPKLKEQAVAVGLTWPDGHVFENTEIKTEEQRRRERELDPAKRPPT